MPLHRNIKGGLIAVVVGVLMAFTNAAPAHASIYAGSNLCTPGDDRVNISVPSSWWFPKIHATSDFTANANGHSFRTCSWRGTNHTYSYACYNEWSNGWALNIVGFESGRPQQRVAHSITCDGHIRTVGWPYGHNDHMAVHYHLWAPSGSGCGESCGYEIGSWYAWVD